MRKMVGVVFFVLLLSTSAAAEDDILRTGNTQEKKFEVGKIETATFYGSVGALWAATAMDIYSGESLDKNRFHEANPMGSTAGQLVGSGIATGAGFFLRRYGNKRMQWFASALLTGGAAAHAFCAAHNFALR